MIKFKQFRNKVVISRQKANQKSQFFYVLTWKLKSAGKKKTSAKAAVALLERFNEKYKSATSKNDTEVQRFSLRGSKTAQI